MKIVILDGYTENPGNLSWDKFLAFGTLADTSRLRRKSSFRGSKTRMLPSSTK